MHPSVESARHETSRPEGLAWTNPSAPPRRAVDSRIGRETILVTDRDAVAVERSCELPVRLNDATDRDRSLVASAWTSPRRHRLGARILLPPTSLESSSCPRRLQTPPVSDVALNIVVGFFVAVAAVVLMQAWPTRYGWATTISLTQGVRSGDPIYRVRIGPARRGRLWKMLRLARFIRRRGPIDVAFYARLAVFGLGLNRNSEFVLPIPVEKAWRPSVQGGLLTTLLPNECREFDLRYFPMRSGRSGRVEPFVSKTCCCSIAPSYVCTLSAFVRTSAHASSSTGLTNWMR